MLRAWNVLNRGSECFQLILYVGEIEYILYVFAPFRMDKFIFSKEYMFCILGARWHKILEFVTSFRIYGWLAWWCDFFPVGSTFGDHPHVFSQKRSSPLEYIFDTCASASSSHLFWLMKLNIYGCSLLLGQIYIQPINMCFVFRARIDTKFLNLSHHFVSMDGWPGDAIFFLWGQPLKIIRIYSAKNGPAP